MMKATTMIQREGYSYNNLLSYKDLIAIYQMVNHDTNVVRSIRCHSFLIFPTLNATSCTVQFSNPSPTAHGFRGNLLPQKGLDEYKTSDRPSFPTHLYTIAAPTIGS
mgnify:CR=1 FL=1